MWYSILLWLYFKTPWMILIKTSRLGLNIKSWPSANFFQFSAPTTARPMVLKYGRKDPFIVHGYPSIALSLLKKLVQAEVLCFWPLLWPFSLPDEKICSISFHAYLMITYAIKTTDQKFHLCLILQSFLYSTLQK